MQELANEAENIYYAIFKKQIPETIKHHFENISKKIDSSYSEAETAKYYHYLSNVKDLEALEVATRLLRKLPVLTVKIKSMVYISETLPENYPVFVNEHSNCFAGYVSLLFSLFRTGYKLAKGFILLAIH